MLVSKVFDHDLMKRITHATIEHKTSGGRVSERWMGAVNELSSRINSGTVINRGGRFDVPLPRYVVNELQLEKVLEPITEKLGTIMNT